MAIDRTLEKPMTVARLRRELESCPADYEIVLEADDSIPVYEFRFLIDHDAKIVRLTSWVF